MAIFTTGRGLQWHYELTGQGDALLFIHGFGASGHWWSMQAKEFAKHHQVITVDLPGHGDSQWMPVNLNDLAIDLKQLLNNVHVEHVSIVASSFGGLVAMELHRIMAEHVMRISFVGVIPKFAHGPNYPAGLDIDNIRKLSNQFDGDIGVILDMFFRSLLTMKERNSEQFKRLKEMRSREALPQKEALKAFLDLLEKVDLRDRLSSIICPLQYITGAEDYICPPAAMEWVKEHSYNARFDVIEGCGHLPFLTEVNEYNRLLEDFLIS